MEWMGLIYNRNCRTHVFLGYFGYHRIVDMAYRHRHRDVACGILTVVTVSVVGLGVVVVLVVFVFRK